MSKAKSKSSAGVILQPEPYAVDGSDLSSFREPYWKAQSVRAEQIAKVRAEEAEQYANR